MRGTRWWTGGCAALAWWVVGCGEAPEPPTAVSPTQNVGAGSKGQTDMGVLTVRPSPDSMVAVPSGIVPREPEPSELEPSDAGLAPAAPEVAPPRTGAARVFSACSETRLVGCDTVYIRMLATKPDLCVQLVMDNCSENDRLGLPVLIPLSWRLSSGSVSAGRACDLREYDPKSQPALTASGKISWAQRGRQISELEIDIQLRVQPPPASQLPAEIVVATAEPIAAVAPCED
ncbi:MAG: hypothetical protein ABI895_06840 [Deltaproteobacteria bacterium]